MFIITRETAEKYLAAKAVAELVEEVTELQYNMNGNAPATVIRQETGPYVGMLGETTSTQTVVPTQAPVEESVPDETVRRLGWSGEIPPLKWMNFYSKVLTRFITDGGVKLTLRMEIVPEKCLSQQKIDEVRIALRELGLNEDVRLE